jgi:hypothetical protein
MAAFIALIGLPLMLSGSATWLIRVTISRIQRYVLPHGSTCERLEWQDIPDGPLRDKDKQEPRRSGRSYGHEHTFQHNDKDCFTSSLGQVFNYAWISAQRRNQRVFKPYSLDPTKPYVRTDRITLEAFLLLSHTDVIEFQDIDGTLTAHLPVANSQPSYTDGQLHSRTKHEVEMILQGYPPFYQEKIKVTDTTTVSSPISSMDDTTRGGWILGVGLDSLMTQHLNTHNMDDGYPLPSHWRVEGKYGHEEWTFTCMSYAVNRYGEVLDKLLVLFPEGDAVRDAAAIFHKLTLDGYISASNLYLFLGNYKAFRELRSPVREYRHGEKPSSPLSCRSKLSKDEWELAMSAFNHNGPLELEEIELFRAKMDPILQAGILGLICVFTMDRRYRKPPYRKLTIYPELQGRKYIYLSQCEPERED